MTHPTRPTPHACDRLLEACGINPINLPATVSREDLHRIIRAAFNAGRSADVMPSKWKEPK